MVSASLLTPNALVLLTLCVCATPARARAPSSYGPITMGGMFTIFKVREKLTGYDDPGLYEPPKGTMATHATAEELKRDGIPT